MVFSDFTPDCRINLAVVALGVHPRLLACLDNLMSHQSDHDFTITCVVNPTTRGAEDTASIPDGVRLVTPEHNVGWAGGLHLARRESASELFVWIQDDLTVLDGWLDALVAAAQTHEDVGVFGSLGVNEQGVVVRYNGGFARPPETTLHWGRTDTVADHTPTEVTHFDWVPSRALMTRGATWDAAGGADPRLYPLDMVDKDYAMHARSHGWRVALVPQARVCHEGQQSAPRFLRLQINRWNAPEFDRRWGPVAARIPATEAGDYDHECSPWAGSSEVPVEAIVGVAASRMLVPFGREATREILSLREERDSRERDIARITQELADLRKSASWRVTAPVRRVVGRGRRLWRRTRSR